MLRSFDFTALRPALTALLLVVAPLLFAMAFLIGPLQGLDEAEHYLRAVQLAERHILPERLPGGKAAGAYLDRTPIKIAGYFEYIERKWRKPYGASKVDVRQARAMPLSGQRSFVNFSNTVIYFPTAHLLPAAAIAVSHMAGVRPFLWAYAGRVVNALIVIVLFACALRRSDGARWFMLLLALLPRTLMSGATLSADALLIPAAGLFAMLLGRLARNNPLTSADTALLISSVFVIAVNKLAYIPLVLLPPALALLADRRMSKTVLLLCATSFMTIMVWLGWIWTIRHDVFTIRHDVPVDVYGQIQYLFAHPAHAVTVLRHSLLWSGNVYLEQLVGEELGSSEAHMPKTLSIGMLLLLLAGAFVGEERKRAEWPALIVALLFTIGTVLCIFLLLYMQFTPIGKDVVDGVQGRYFLPLLPILVPFLPKFSLTMPTRSLVTTTGVGWVVVASLVAAVLFEQRYWNSDHVDPLRFATSRHTTLE